MFITPRRIVAGFLTVTIAAATVGIMTQPAPGTTELDFASQIQDVPVSPVVMRIGVVSDIIDSTSITVKISGSDVLVQASYLFPQYRPILGDRVVVIRQDAQWIVLGTMSGPINTVLTNPSFEEGPLGGIPPGWSIEVVSSGGGVPTFTKVVGDGPPLSGSFVADFGTDATVAGLSEAYVYSDPQPAAPGQRWTAAYYITWANVDQSTSGTSGNRFAVIYCEIQFLDDTNTVLQTSTISITPGQGIINDLQYVVPGVGTPWAFAPIGTTQVRLRLDGIFDMDANSFTSFFIDYMVLRQG